MDNVVHFDGYHGLVDVSYDKHDCAEYGRNEFANNVFHINGIESFWAYVF